MRPLIWEIVFLLLILKIPLVWVCWVVWWSIKAEPEVGADGENNQDMNWRPWRRPPGSRPARGGPHGRGARKAARRARARERAGV
jgi:hypothetical protein